MIDLEVEDRRQLIRLLQDLPQLATPQQRRQILEFAGLGQFVSRINLSGDTFTVVNQIVGDLSKYGRLNDKQEVLGVFLNALKDFVGVEQQQVLDRLLHKYQMTMPSSPPLDVNPKPNTQLQTQPAPHPQPEAAPPSPAVVPKPEPTSDSENQAIEVFFSYAHEDEELRDELAKHLKLLQRQKVISTWYDRDISAGNEWKQEIDKRLNSADVILLLISSDFLASDFCWGVELKRAMERHEAAEARVIPIILREVDWKGAPFGKLQALPKNAQPVTNWANRDQPFADITRGIRKAVEGLAPPEPPPLPNYPPEPAIYPSSESLSQEEIPVLKKKALNPPNPIQW